MAVAAAAGVLVLSACTAGGDPGDTEPTASGGPDPTVSESPSPEPFAFPEPGDAGEAAFYRAPGSGAGESGEIISGPAVIEPGSPTFVEGACEGTSVPFEVTSADLEDANRVLIEGRLQCDDPSAINETGHSLEYDGPVQVRFTDTENIEQGWIRVIQR